MINKLQRFERTAVRPVFGGLAQRIDLQNHDSDGSTGKLYATLASYSGHLKHGAALKDWEEIWPDRPWLRALLKRRDWSLIERWSRRGMNRARHFRSQYWGVVRYADNDSLVFFQVGRFFQFYGPQRVLAVQALKLRNIVWPRSGYAFRAGFPTHLSGLFALRAISLGLTVVEARQVSETPLGNVSRLPRALFFPTRNGMP